MCASKNLIDQTSGPNSSYVGVFILHSQVSQDVLVYTLICFLGFYFLARSSVVLTYLPCWSDALIYYSSGTFCDYDKETLFQLSAYCL